MLADARRPGLLALKTDSLTFEYKYEHAHRERFQLPKRKRITRKTAAHAKQHALMCLMTSRCFTPAQQCSYRQWSLQSALFPTLGKRSEKPGQLIASKTGHQNRFGIGQFV